MAVRDAFNKAKSLGLAGLEMFAPIPKVSHFKDEGVLMPEEFVIAGDHLVHACPTWHWAAGDESMAKSYLPKDKQYLVTKQVPCFQRARSIGGKPNQERILDENDTEGGWVDTHPQGEGGAADITNEMSLDSDARSSKQAPLAVAAGGGTGKKAMDDDDDDDDEEPADMEDYMAHGGMEDANDPSAVTPAQLKQQEKQIGDVSDEVEKVRTYDLFITYDLYYRTPRFWLVGYNEDGKPLSVNQMYEDFSEEHARKTITMESFPQFNTPPMASIHPCRHAEVMKRILSTAAEGGKDIGVHFYLVIFLKFVQTVIPTINYDFSKTIMM